jgi:lysyl-tRNA synthetase class 2
VRHALITAAAGTAAAILAGTAVFNVWVRHPHLPLGQALAAVTMRLVGITSIALPENVNDFMTSAMIGVGLGLVALAAWTVFRPAYGTRRALGSGIERAREIVAVHAGDSLSSFALRQDKELFFHGDTVVPYSVTGRVCLVSPDPVGPTWERDSAWDAFHRYADGRGWPVAVLGASDDWLPVYRRSGMREVYVGDEAVVDCRHFVEPVRADHLRAAVRQVREAGYRVEFLDPARLDAYLESALRGLATEVHRPGCEQRLAMTLGRLFDPEDRNLLLAVAMGPDNHPAAFCQFVPAPAIGGYTLDQVRRTTRDIPARLVEAILVETILHLGTGGTHYLGLNFSVMSRKLARSDADGLGGRAQRWLLDHLSRPDQAGNPWRVDEMFEPEWRPRYFVYDGRGHFPSAAMAMGRAESQRPFPSIGHPLTPSAETESRAGTGGNGRGNGAHGPNGHKRARRNARNGAPDQDEATNGERRAGWKASSGG